MADFLPHLRLRTLIDPSMEVLPAELTIDIFSRLPVKTIVHCKLVCKKWRNLLSDSLFVSLHLSRSPTGCLIFHHQREANSGILKWVEIEEKIDDHHHLHYDSLMTLDLKKLMITIYDIGQMGSVNGLICLRQYSFVHDKVYICNPVTREIMTISNAQFYTKFSRMNAYGFGVASSTGEYKVVRTFKFLWGSSELGSEVYTLGTGQWRRLGRVPYLLDDSDFGVVLNDHCHWIVHHSKDAPEKICSFDLNKETFQLFPSPPPPPSSEAIRDSGSSRFQRLAILKGCLCKSDGNGFPFTIWVMKEYGIKKSWHKEVVITKEALNRVRELRYYNYAVYLIGCLKDTIFFMSGDLFAFYPRSDTIEKIEKFKWPDGGQVYCPSFLKLQNFETQRVHKF